MKNIISKPFDIEKIRDEYNNSDNVIFETFSTFINSKIRNYIFSNISYLRTKNNNKFDILVGNNLSYYIMDDISFMSVNINSKSSIINIDNISFVGYYLFGIRIYRTDFKELNKIYFGNSIEDILEYIKVKERKEKLKLIKNKNCV